MSFRHALVQDVAYESLPFARRRELHGRIARYLEATEVGQDHTLLVHHYQRAGEAERTRFHAVKASESSVALSAHREAVDYLSVAMGTVTGRSADDACLRSRFEELMGDSFETMARPEEAIACFTKARRRWISPAARLASERVLFDLAPIDDAAARDSFLCWKIAVTAERGHSAYERSLRWLDKAAANLPPDRNAMAARILVSKSGFLGRLGRFEEALPIAEEGVALARSYGDESQQAYALNMLSNTLLGLGFLRRAITVLHEAVALYEGVGDLLGQALCHVNLGAGYHMSGDLPTAREHYELALSLSARLSNMRGVVNAHVNLGELLLQLGDTEEAVSHLDEAVRYRVGHGVSPSLIGFAFVNLGRSHLRLGDLDAAERRSRKAERC